MAINMINCIGACTEFMGYIVIGPMLIPIVPGSPISSGSIHVYCNYKGRVDTGVVP
jgi:hypothetical protein